MATHSSILENPMDRGAWRATAHGIAELDVTEQLTGTLYCPPCSFPGGSDSKESACNAGDPGLIHNLVGLQICSRVLSGESHDILQQPVDDKAENAPNLPIEPALPLPPVLLPSPCARWTYFLPPLQNYIPTTCPGMADQQLLLKSKRPALLVNSISELSF